MRPILTAVVVAVVLLSAVFLVMVPAEHPGPSHSTLPSGLRTAVTPSYTVYLGFATEPVLPGYHDSLVWQVVNDTTAVPIETLSTLTIKAIYYNTLDKLLPLPGTPINVTPTASGTFSFLVPVNATSNDAFEPTFTVYANSSSLHMSQTGTDSLEVGYLTFAANAYEKACTVTGVQPCGDLTTGAPATVYLTALVEDGFGDTTPATGETAKFIFFSTGSSPVTVSGVPASVTTNGAGYAAVTFTPLSTIFNVPGPNHVELEVTDSVNTSLTVYHNVTFNLYNPVGTANWVFSLNQALYYSGESGTASWQWAGTNSTVGTLNVTNYYVLDVDTDNLIGSGTVNSVSPTGSFPFTLPTNYVGEFEVVAVVHNTSEAWDWAAEADAEAAILTIIPSEHYFNPGDTITVDVSELGPALNGATTSAYVEASNSGQSLFNGTVTGGSFQFTIPKVAPADEYVIAVWASTTANGTVAAVTQDVDEASGYSLATGVGTVSSYADNSFAPGQTIQVDYKLTAYGTYALPTLLTLYIYPGSCLVYCDFGPLQHWVLTSPSGSVAFTIPSGTPNGQQSYIVYADFSTGAGSGELTVNVNSAPSALNYELGAGSGLTVGWLILLILLIVVALVVLLAMRGRGRSPRMVMSPASSGSAPEWKEPQSQPASSTPPSGDSGGGNTGGTSGDSGSGGGAASAPPGAQ
jgi:hypothetical protein